MPRPKLHALNLPLLVALSLSGSLISCDRADPAKPAAPAQAAARPTSASPSAIAGRDAVIAASFPVWYFATRISGGLVPVECPLPPGEDPMAWRPSPAHIAQFQSAGLIALNGAGYEPWLGAASLPLSRTVESAAAFPDDLLTYRTITHTHGPGGAHSHTGVDGHTWMDPLQATRQAAAIAAAMARRWPAHQKAFGDNLRALEADLASLDADLRRAAELAPGALLMSNHPAYAYIARRYGLAIEPLDLPPDTPPSDAQWAALDAFVRAAPAQSGPRIMLFEDEPLDATRSTLRERWSITTVLFDPREAMPDRPSAPDADYVVRMRDNIARLTAALRSAGTPPTH